MIAAGTHQIHWWEEILAAVAAFGIGGFVVALLDRRHASRRVRPGARRPRLDPTSERGTTTRAPSRNARGRGRRQRPLRAVARATRRLRDAERAWKEAIADASAAGFSSRDVAEHAGVSHVKVCEIRAEIAPPQCRPAAG